MIGSCAFGWGQRAILSPCGQQARYFQRMQAAGLLQLSWAAGEFSACGRQTGYFQRLKGAGKREGPYLLPVLIPKPCAFGREAVGYSWRSWAVCYFGYKEI